jgi:putative membrane protein
MRRRSERLLVGAIALAAPLAAHAHHPGDSGWSPEPWVVGLLAFALLGYVVGVTRLWARAGTARGIGWHNVGCFVAGWSALAVALATPVDALGTVLFSMHMAQHELLMVVAAPLLVLSRPLEAWIWAFPAKRRPQLAGAFQRPLPRALWSRLTSARGAWLFHFVVLWAWHLPVLFEAGLHHEPIHALQHTSFLVSALCFWWTVLHPDKAGSSTGAAFASVFTTLLHTGVLGALLTFSRVTWYPAYAGYWGLTALEDQQLGGLLMWVPAGLPYIVAGLWLVSRYLDPAERGAPPLALRPAIRP